MKKTLLAIALLAVTYGASSAPPKDVLSDKDIVELTKHSLESELKDPSSVQFRNVTIVRKKSGSKSVCGEYNAKNSYGGYVGFKRFVALNSNPFLVKTDVDDENWIMLCMTDEQEGRLNAAKGRFAAKQEADKAEVRQTRRENIERNCAEKRQAIEETGGPDVQAKKDELAQSCADLIRKSNAN